jgi:hypothetical protein
MTTTIPMTTKAMSTYSTQAQTGLIQSEKEGCQINIPDYNVLRLEKLNKINKYYNDLLSSYTKNYTDYSTQKISANINDRTYAETTLKPKVSDYNQQMINVSKNLINTVNRDTDLIVDQKNQLKEKTKTVDDLKDDIKVLTLKDKELNIKTNADIDSLNNTKTGTKSLEFMNNVYIVLNIILLIVIIGMVVMLMM